MKKDQIPALRKELENSFGRKILSSRDCLQMVEDIYQKTGFSINANTLRRFFGLVKTDYSASPSTLAILSKYCGFNSIDEIETMSSATTEEGSVNNEEILRYILSLFKNLPVTENHNEMVELLVQQTVIFLERNPSLIDRFQRELAKTTTGQYYYYELSVNMDRLNDYYGNGLRYYLRAKNNNEAKVFFHAVNVLRYWLSGNTALMEKQMAALSAIPVTQNFPSHILGRLIAARIYYAHSKNEPVDKILQDATRYHVAILSGRSGFSLSFPHFELCICEALILTNQHQEAIEFIRRGKPYLAAFKDSTQKNPFALWETLISNKKANPLKIPGHRGTPRPTYSYNAYLNKRYNNLLFLSQERKSRDNHLTPIILETGFTIFDPS